MFASHVTRWRGVCCLAWLSVCVLLAPQRAKAATPRTGQVQFVASQTLYARVLRHTFRVGDTLQLIRARRVIGTWKIIAVTSKTVAAQRLTGDTKPKKGDLVRGVGSRVERAETRVTRKKEISAETRRQLWLDVRPSIGGRVAFRNSSLINPLPSPKTKLEYDVMLQYLGVFGQNNTFQNAVLQSRMDLSNLLGTGFWHRHLVRVRFDFADPNDPWGGKYRPNLEVYQLSAGYRWRMLNLGLGRLSRIPSEVGLVDGIKVQVNPTPLISLIAYGGLAPDERSLLPRLGGIRYGFTAQINPSEWHTLTRVGFAGQLEQGQLDRHLVFAQTQLSPTKWLELFARGVVEVVLPDNPFGRVAPEISSLTADARFRPLDWLDINVRYDAFRPALNLNWLNAWKENLPTEVFQEYFTEEIRHSARLAATFQKASWALRSGFSADYFYDSSHSFTASAWFHWYQVAGLPIRLYGRYAFLHNSLISQGHQGNVRLGGTIADRVEVSAGYGLAAYFGNQETWELEHTVRADLNVLLPFGLSILVASQFRFGEIDQSILITSQLRWRFDT